MSASESDVGYVWMTGQHAAAVGIALARMRASAARNLAEGGDDEGDADWADVLEHLLGAWDVRDQRGAS